MNIAVLIGVSSYTNLNSLPACACDVTLMKALLDATGKYEEILAVTTNTSADRIKDKIRAFFASYLDKKIDEALFYFSGHGTFHDEDVLLSCSDFHESRPKSTSIPNREVDDLLRSVGPALAVKVLDACRSGVTYIKDTEDAFEKAIKKTSLKAFICMSSSLLDQSSWAGPDASLFTATFVEGALLRDQGDVLYRDIQAHLADSFLNVSPNKQTPHFVNQGTGLEKFATVTPEMTKMKGGSKKPGSITKPGDDMAMEIQSAVSREDTLHLPEADVIKALNDSRHLLENAKINDALVSTFYRKSQTTDTSLGKLPTVSKIAEFADQQGWRNKYLVKIEREMRNFRVPKNPLLSITSGLMYRDRDEDYVIEARPVPTSISSTHELPFETARVDYLPISHPSLKSFALFLGIVHSRTNLEVLNGVGVYIAKGWDQPSLDGPVAWKAESLTWHKIYEDPSSLWRESVQLAETKIRAYLESLVKKDETPTPLSTPPPKVT